MSMSSPVHPPMDQFAFEDGELVIGGQRLSRLAERVGATPFYAYDRALLARRVGELRQALPAAVKLHYAMKANPLPALVCLMVGLVDGIDVASAGELQVALNAGAPAAEVSFAGPAKAASELRQAVAAGVLVNVESLREVQLLEGISSSLAIPARVAVRVNPDFELKGSGMKMGGGPKQFGIDVDDVPDVLARIGSAGLAFEGFHLFAGSQNLRAESICDAQRQSFELALRLAEHAPGPVRFLNLGGGFGIAYLSDDDPVSPHDVAGRLRAVVAAECAAFDLPVPRLAVEPGRAIAGPGTVTLYEIGTIKPVRLGASGAPGAPLVRNYVSVDGGMSDNIRTALYDAAYTCVLANRTSDAPPALCRVVGKHCESGDVLVRDLWLPADVQPGDLLAVAATGAYCWSMASNYNYLLKPPVVAVRDGAATEIVRRQTLSDVFALDPVLAGSAPAVPPSQPAVGVEV